MLQESFDNNALYIWEKIQQIFDKLNADSICETDAINELNKIINELIMLIKLEDSHVDKKEFDKYRRIDINITNLKINYLPKNKVDNQSTFY